MRLGRQPLIVGTVGTAAALRRCARQAPAHCDWIEVRLDLTGWCGGRWVEWCAAAQNKGRPVLLTIRHAREGGQWDGREADRLALYLAGLPVVSAVDMEIGSRGFAKLAPAAREAGVQVVGSFHDFQGTPSLPRLLALETRGRLMGANVVKFATTIRSATDMANLFAMPAHTCNPICLIGMGKQAVISRVALPAAGSCLAYGSLGTPTAPGQMTCQALAKELARFGIRAE